VAPGRIFEPDEPCSLLAMQPTSFALSAVIEQTRRLLLNIDPELYHQPLPEYSGSSLGQHFRHIIEFFICLDRGRHTSCIDYASRERNLLYETNPLLAAEALDLFEEAMPFYDIDEPIRVRAEFNGDARPEYPSSLGREMLFVFDHAIHHLALIKIGLINHAPHLVADDPDLGVSPSTLKARRWS
jgi:hypothetical protein